MQTSGSAQLRKWIAGPTGVLLGILYGLLFRLSTSLPSALPRQLYSVMSLSFLTLVPLVIGFLAVYYSGQREPTVVRSLLLPWPAILLTLAATAVLALEGFICIVFLAPIALIFGSLGGLVARAFLRRRGHDARVASCFALLPFLCMAAEGRLTSSAQMRTVENTIVVHADAATVWQNIQSVPPIATSELRPTWTHRIGFPRPVAAVLSHPGVGGVRTASFEHGLIFYETVNDWQPLHQLGFSIKADTDHIPPTTLDEHVKIGGRYFDVLDGQYRIEQRANGTILLRLTSHQRLSTDFNGYAGLWSDAVMSSLQSSILQVIQHRCERQPATLSATIK